ncbi:MAG: hypothetical protein IJY04_08430 [Clostridia bacterium]|nr:hypothetical protein [Clostridia bacterium]
MRSNSECHILADTPTLLSLEFCDNEYKDVRIWSFTFKPEQNAVCLYPVCDEKSIYNIGEERVTGEEIGLYGVEMKVGERFTAELLSMKKEN